MNYRAEKISAQGVPVVRLTDTAQDVEVSILPWLGNRAYQMKVRGVNILYYPPGDLSEHVKNPSMGGIPFLAPWADLLDEQAFWANGKKYSFNMGLGNVVGDRPIHGLLTDSRYWQVTEVLADNNGASVTSRLEFWKVPDLMAQWPFAHEYEMTYRLSDGVLEVKTTIANLSTETMPVAIGFHPYFQIPGIARDEWIAHLAAQTHVIADKLLVPTGEMRPLNIPNLLPLRGRALDDGFTDLVRDSAGRASFRIESSGKTLEILFGPKYPVATIYLPAPPPEENAKFICIEPLTAIISGVNLAHRGIYSDLQVVAPGALWTESFWVRHQGF